MNSHKMMNLVAFVCLILAVFVCSQVSAAPIVKREYNDVPTTPQPKKSINTIDDAKNYLEKFGYMGNSVKSQNNALSDDEKFKKALEDIQKFAGLKVTGQLDDATKSLMETPRCHLPDKVAPKGVFSKRFNLMRPSWTDLSYNISNSPSKTNYSLNVESSIKYAANLWSVVANLNITRSFTGVADIKIGFYSGDHGDGGPFDGPYGILAHAFFPKDGKLHFDDAETWSGGPGINLMQVATHEFGHSIGIAHSLEHEAVMYPYITYKPDFALNNDDINAVIALYGKRNGYQIPPTTPDPTRQDFTSASYTPVYTQSGTFIPGISRPSTPVLSSSNWITARIPYTPTWFWWTT